VLDLLNIGVELADDLAARLERPTGEAAGRAHIPGNRAGRAMAGKRFRLAAGVVERVRECR